MNSQTKYLQSSDINILEIIKPQISRVIKQHQIEGISFLVRNIIDEGSGCILAHSMGLGKTIQIICFCDIFLKDDLSKTILMLMPVNTIQHCLSEFEHWLPLDARNFNVYTIKDFQTSLKQRLDILTEWSQNGGVLILGYELFRLFMLRKVGKKRLRNESVDFDETYKLQDKLKALLVKANLVVLDEGHKIKHFDIQLVQVLKEMYTRLRIVLTGYPLQNNLMEYFCIMDYVKPNVLGSVKEFEILFVTPITNGQYSDSTPKEVELMRYRTYVLHSLLIPCVHRRCELLLQNALPEKVEYILLFRMTKLQKELYTKVMSVNKKNPISVFGIICKIMNDPDVLFDFLRNKQRDSEDIDITDQQSKYACLEDLMQAYVPGSIENSPKMIALFQIINDILELKDRIIGFSQSLLTLNMIEKYLQVKLNWIKNLHYYRIDGSTTQQARQSMINKFNLNSDLKLFLFSTKAGCMGINLVGASRVVIFDASFNPCDDLQAIGRVYRYGQTKKTFIYRFIMDQSLEKSIYDHQVKKQQISCRVIDKKNPEPYMSIEEASSPYLKDEESSEIKDFCASADKYADIVMQNLLRNFSVLFTQEPLIHETFLIDHKENDLSKTEAILANTDFKLAKVAGATEIHRHDSPTEMSIN